MYRKLTFAIAAIAALGAVSLNATDASAWHPKKHGHHKHWKKWHKYHYGFYGPGYFASPDCYVVRRVVWTKYGKRIRRRVVCY